MNADHADSTVAMVKHYVGITGECGGPREAGGGGGGAGRPTARVSRCGAGVARGRLLPPPPAPTEFCLPSCAQELIVEMTRAAAAAQQKG